MKQIPSWFIAAYSTMPKGPWDPAVEELLLDSYRTPRVDLGWEIPFTGSLHKYDEKWFLERIRPRESLVITTIPGVMDRLKSDPLFGLASSDEHGRQRAVSFMAEVLEALNRANKFLGRTSVVAVEIHSAPNVQMGGSAEAFTSSLQEIASWEWQGAELLIEHCDSYSPERPGSKEFLSLEDEIAVCLNLREQTSTPIGIAINWGRSAIEGRSASTAVDHILRAKEVGLLRGFMFSGCSPQPASRGGAWADFHLPPRINENWAEPSILDFNAVANTLEAIGDPAELVLFGMKVSCPDDSTPARRIETVNGSMNMFLGPSNTVLRS